MEELKIRDVLQKQRAGQPLTADEQKQLDEWYAHFPEYEELTFNSDKEKNRIKNEIRSGIFAHINKKEETPVIPLARRNVFTITRKIAAAVLILVTLGGLVYLRKVREGASEMAFTEIKSPGGKMASLVKLPDGSEVWLHPGSTLRYPAKFDENLRKVELRDGMAYFSVTHNKDAPFIVQTSAGIETKVLGTTFNIKAYRGLPQVEITLITGSVSVSDSTGQLGILKPNQRLTYSKQTHHSEIEETDASRSVGWKGGLIVFQESTFDEVALTLEDIYKIHFSYDKKQMSSYKFNMRCSNQLPIIQVADILKDVAGLQYKIEKDTIHISPR